MTEEKKISEYLEVLSSKAPVPGGGGASEGDPVTAPPERSNGTRRSIR